MPLYRVFYLAFLLWSLPQCAGAQQLVGAYCSGEGFMNTCIVFEQNNRFSYSREGCLGGVKGIGTYTIKGNSLILLFKDSNIVRPRIEWAADVSETEADSVHWKFEVVDERGYPVPGMIIRTSKAELGTLTDANGSAGISLPKAARKVTLLTFCVGFNTDTYPFVLSQQNDCVVKVKANMTQYYDPVPGGTSYRYRIRNVGDDGFELKSNDRETSFERYLKRRPKDDLD